MLARLPLAVLALSLAAPGLAQAASVCVAKSDTPMSAVAVVEGAATPLGFLAHRRCYGVLERLEGRTRVFVNAGGFRGEVEIPDENLLWVLAEDIPMRLAEGEEPFGLALAGTGVAIESETEEGWVVRTVDGRMQARFRVAGGEMLPAEVWPSLAPDEIHPGGKWPEATLALPPSAVAISGRSGTRANVGAPLFVLDDVLVDPGLGALRYAVLDPEEHIVQVVGPTLWVQGTVTDLDWRRETLLDPETEAPREDWEGWDEVAGYRLPGPPAPLPREVASKDAPLSTEPKGARVALLAAGARVEVVSTEGPWLQVTHRWDGGSVTGWLDKKRLVKEGKELGKPEVVVPRASVVRVGEVSVAWVEPGPEQATDKDGNPKVDKEGAPVVDPNETHEGPPEYTAPWLRLALREQIGRLRYFYGRALAKSGKKGSITVRGEVAEDGTIAWELVDASLEDDDVTEVIQGVLDGIEGPERKLRKARKDIKDYRIELKTTLSFAPFSG